MKKAARASSWSSISQHGKSAAVAWSETRKQPPPPPPAAADAWRTSSSLGRLPKGPETSPRSAAAAEEVSEALVLRVCVWGGEEVLSALVEPGRVGDRDQGARGVGDWERMPSFRRLSRRGEWRLIRLIGITMDTLGQT